MPDANTRFREYAAALSRYGMPLDHSLAERLRRHKAKFAPFANSEDWVFANAATGKANSRILRLILPAQVAQSEWSLAGPRKITNHCERRRFGGGGGDRSHRFDAVIPGVDGRARDRLPGGSAGEDPRGRTAQAKAQALIVGVSGIPADFIQPPVRLSATKPARPYLGAINTRPDAVRAVAVVGSRLHQRPH
jgi:hypothetical protein